MKGFLPTLAQWRAPGGEQTAVTVQCDGCGTQFRPQPERRPTESGGEEISFDCPRCRKRFVAFRATKQGRMMHWRLREIRVELLALQFRSGREARKRREKLLEEFRALREEIECEVTT